jgi:CheY-like chemotaxis protein
VEDDEDTREMYAHWCASVGLRVATAVAAGDAFEQAKRLRPEIVLTDLGLGARPSGCELAANIRRTPETHGIPLVAVTGWLSEDTIVQALQAGCDAVFLKPIAPDVILATIHRLLTGRPSVPPSPL